MAQNFSVPRNIVLSCLNYLQTNLNISWNGVTVVRSFAEVYATKVNVPVVCVRLSDTASVYREIGDTVTEDRFLIVCDIFASSDPQREDLAYSVKQLLALGFAHNDYQRISGNSSGQISSTPNGRNLITSFVTDAQINIPESVDAKDKYRHNISVRVRNSPLIPT